MAVPKNLSKDDIFKAIKYIDENGVPNEIKSEKYELVLTSTTNEQFLLISDEHFLLIENSFLML